MASDLNIYKHTPSLINSNISNSTGKFKNESLNEGTSQRGQDPTTSSH